jgi:hypothetical protein
MSTFEIVGDPCPAPPGLLALYDLDDGELDTAPVIVLVRCRDVKTKGISVVGLCVAEWGLDFAEDVSNFSGYAIEGSEDLVARRDFCRARAARAKQS